MRTTLIILTGFVGSAISAMIGRALQGGSASRAALAFVLWKKSDG
jgi:hypothetical protein